MIRDKGRRLSRTYVTHVSITVFPAISPYLRHGCMAGYPYHAPLGHSHLTLAYEKTHRNAGDLARPAGTDKLSKLS